MIDVFKFFKKIPGGALLIPMLISALINTLFPDLWTTIGGTSMATFKGGSLVIVGIILFALGADTNIKMLGKCLQRNGVLILAKIVLALVCGFLFTTVFGMEGIMGISAVAFMACICSTNPGVYIGLMQDYGDQIDMGNVPLMTIISGVPLIPLLVLSSAGGVSFDIMSIITVLLPYVLGLVLGNLDPKLAKMYNPISNILLPFLGFNFGSSINLIAAAKAGVGGIILGVLFVAVNALVLITVDKAVNKRPGYAGAAMCSVAGFAVAVPSLLGEAFAQYQAAAVSQVALCMVVSCILNPFITRAVVKKWGSAKS